MKLALFLLAQLCVAQKVEEKAEEVEAQAPPSAELKIDEEVDEEKVEEKEGKAEKQEEDEVEEDAFDVDAEAKNYYEGLVELVAGGEKEIGAQQALVQCAQKSIQEEKKADIGCVVDGKCVLDGKCGQAKSFEISVVAKFIGTKLKGNCGAQSCGKCKRADLGVTSVKERLAYEGKVFEGICNVEGVCVDQESVGVQCMDLDGISNVMQDSSRKLSAAEQSAIMSKAEFGEFAQQIGKAKKGVQGLNAQQISAQSVKASATIEHNLRETYRQPKINWFPEAQNLALVRNVTVAQLCETKAFYGCKVDLLGAKAQKVYSSCVSSNVDAIYVNPSFKGFGCAPVEHYFPGTTELDLLHKVFKEVLESSIDGYVFDSPFYPYQAIFNLQQFPSLIHGNVQTEGIELGVAYHQTLNTSLYQFFSALGEFSEWNQLTLNFTKKRQFAANMNISVFQLLFGKIQALNLNLTVTQIVHVLGDWCKLEPQIHSQSSSSYHLLPGGIVQKKTTTLYHRYEVEYRTKLTAHMASYCADVYPVNTYRLSFGGVSGLIGRPIRLLNGSNGDYDSLEEKLYNGIVIPGAHHVGRVVPQPGCSWITPGQDKYNKVPYYYSYTRDVEINAGPCFNFVSTTNVTVMGMKYELARKPFSCECQPTYSVSIEAIKKRYTTAVTTYTNYKIKQETVCIIWTLATAINVGIKVTQQNFSKSLMIEKANSYGQHKVQLTSIEKSSLSVTTVNVTVGVSIYVYSTCFKRVKIISDRPSSCASYCHMVKSGGLTVGGSQQLSVKYNLQRQTDAQAVKAGNFQASYLGDDDEEVVEEDALSEEANEGSEDQDSSAATFFVAFALLF